MAPAYAVNEYYMTNLVLSAVYDLFLSVIKRG